MLPGVHVTGQQEKRTHVSVAMPAPAAENTPAGAVLVQNPPCHSRSPSLGGDRAPTARTAGRPCTSSVRAIRAHDRESAPSGLADRPLVQWLQFTALSGVHAPNLPLHVTAGQSHRLQTWVHTAPQWMGFHWTWKVETSSFRKSDRKGTGLGPVWEGTPCTAHGHQQSSKLWTATPGAVSLRWKARRFP